MPSRNFGIEIEAFGLTREQAARVITAAGIVCNVEIYGHTAPQNWKVVSDASVNGGLHVPGFEVVSPILNGEDGFQQVMTVTRALSQAGARINRTCGLHVHVDARGLSAADIKNIVYRYNKHESAIDAFMPQSRRGSANEYCQSMSSIVSRVVSCRSTINDIIDVTRETRPRGDEYNRYLKINLSAYLRHGTLEFRHHSGTINGTKAVNWVKFCLNFVEQSIIRTEEVVVDEVVTILVEASTTRRYGRSQTRMNIILRMLQTESGATLDELARATELQQNSIRVMLSTRLREMGFRSVYVSRTERYRAVPLTQATQTVARRTTRVVERHDDSAFYGLPAEIVTYYNERASEFANS